MPATDTQLDRSSPGRLRCSLGGTTVMEYVYEPSEPAVESPRPYAVMRTRAGDEASGHRPDDHPWHRGVSLALGYVGAHNFWGGATYVRDRGYVQLANNGAQEHRSFGDSSGGSVARIAERLDWVGAPGSLVLTERRALTVRAVAGGAWALTWSSTLRNATEGPLTFGSPTTRGRPDAGYGGIFWRGPDSFTGGRIESPEGSVGDAARGTTSPWLAYLAPRADVGVLMLDAGPGRPHPWFARSDEYAALGPAPFFHEEATLDPGAALDLRAALVVGDRRVAAVAGSVGVELVAELDGTGNDHEGSA